jgi:hypothetical protein
MVVIAVGVHARMEAICDSLCNPKYDLYGNKEEEEQK